MFESINHNAELLQSVKSKQCECLHDIQSISGTIKQTTRRINNMENQINRQVDMLKLLSYKSLDLEARERRNNLIFWGIFENFRIDCQSIILNFLSDELNIDSTHVSIERAHRMNTSKRRNQYNDPKRPIIVRFSNYNDVDNIMNSAYKLKGTSFGIDRNYPTEIVQARRELYQSQMATSARQNRIKTEIKYPASLYIDGKMIKDKFPDWYTTMKQSRLHVLSYVNNSNTTNVEQSIQDQSNTSINQSVYSNKTIEDTPTHDDHNEVFRTPGSVHRTQAKLSKPSLNQRTVGHPADKTTPRRKPSPVNSMRQSRNKTVS